jgi:hypothetical protein
MADFHNPALAAFTHAIGVELTFAQVLVRRDGQGWELRHADDRGRAVTELRTLTPEEVRTIAQFTTEKKFRPLKSAPTLASGWRFVAPSATELEDALNRLHPGGIADWFAAQGPTPPITHFREFANRQSGMYRIAATLDDAQAAGVIRATCAASACLKRRLWSVPGLDADPATEKSVIPCLEPCALLLDAARKAGKEKAERLKG